MDKLLKILTELKPDVDFLTETVLVDNAILDSFDIVNIVEQCENLFSIKFLPLDIVPETFNSAKKLWDVIESKIDADTIHTHGGGYLNNGELTEYPNYLYMAEPFVLLAA